MTDDPQTPSVVYSDAGTVFVIANGAFGHARATAAALNAGLRIVGRSDLVPTLDASAAATIFVEVDTREPFERDALVALLHDINGEVADGSRVAIVSAPAGMIDFVAAAAPDVIHLADATDADRIAAMAIASARAWSGVRETAGGNAELVRLARLTEEVARVATALARLTPAPVISSLVRVNVRTDPVGADEIRDIIRARTLRAHYFDPDLFADPAWDMLLDLAAAHASRERVAVSSLCIAAAVPPTTALRWIRTLTDAGLFVRTADPADGRRVFIELSEPAAASMQAYLSACRRLA